MRVNLQLCVATLSSSLVLAACSEADPPAAGDGSSSTTDANSTGAGPVTPNPGTPDPSATGGTGADTGGTTDSGTTSTGDSDDDMGGMPPVDFDLGGLPDAPKVPEPIPDFDCDDVPESFVSYQQIAGPRGYHGLEITRSGLMIGSDGSSLIDSTYAGDWGVFIPGIGQGQQMDWLPDGDLAHATSNGAITRIRLDGTTEVIRPGVNGYGVVLGPDEQLYITTGNSGNTVQRLDPISGDIETIITSPGPTLHSVGFSVDGTRMYIGTVGGGGVMYYVDFNGAMDPGPTTIFTTDATTGGSNWHDAVAVDACGYVYTTDYYSSNMFRVTPGGDGVLYWNPADNGHYPHGLVWGTGDHGWQDDALYFPQPYDSNNVGELVVGVPPATFEGVVSNAPPHL